MENDNYDYHAAGAYVEIGLYAFDISTLWHRIDTIERGGISLSDIGLALDHNWPATVTALAFENIATLRALIAEARESAP
jgi:hypothetical protein